MTGKKLTAASAPTGQRWQQMWHRYAEFLREYGRRPDSAHSKERSLAIWYEYNSQKWAARQLDEGQRASFAKLTDGGDTYKFYVSHRKECLPQLAFFGRSATVFGTRVGSDGWGFEQCCREYMRFCKRMERHPRLALREEQALAKWYLQAADDLRNHRLIEYQAALFGRLLQSTKVYAVNNEVAQPPEFLDAGADRAGREATDEIISVEDGTEFHAGASDSRWFDVCHSYEKYLDAQHRVPTQKAVPRLYHWLYRQKRQMREGALPQERQQALTRLLAKIETLREQVAAAPAQPKTACLQPKISNQNSTTENRRPKTKPESHDDLWNRKWQAYMDFLDKHKRRPSKHYAEDMPLFDWFKHSKRLLNRGQMQPNRVEKFRLLLGEATDLQRINQHNYVNSNLSVSARPIHLYDYQADMKRRIELAFLTHSSVMVQMPTGTGKTHVIASVVRDFVRDGMGQVWVVAHRRELVAQIHNTLALYLTDDEMHHVVATSIQWLTIHYKEMVLQPSLIVIDEAHHAIAKTYAAVLNAYPVAKKLGVTATPYRLSGAGFGDLFQILLTSWDIKTFIQKKFLCPFDYYCITRRSIEMYKVDRLTKRGADGDYQIKELNENFNQSTIIARLFQSYQRLAKGKRGFVYAISISHAQNIAKYYSAHGVAAVAVSSETPDAERARAIADFKDGLTTVLCSVDLFSEGFDAPDAEFIQLARPTLSLAKYLQMVGRGLRMAKGKKACIILDNVGLKDKFGLPSRPRNWPFYFEGSGRRRLNAATGNPDGSTTLVDSILGTYIGPVDDNDMILEAAHADIASQKSRIQREYHVVRTHDGRHGIVDKNGGEVLAMEYDNISLGDDGIATVRWGETAMWYDLENGRWYDALPQLGYVGSVPMAYAAHHFYPRLRSPWLGSHTSLSEKDMLMQFGDGLSLGSLFITWTGRPRVFRVVDSHNSGARLLRDEQGRKYVQRNPRTKPVSTAFIKDLAAWFRKRDAEFADFVNRAKNYPIEHVDTNIARIQQGNKRVWAYADGIITVIPRKGKKYWIDTITRRRFNKQPHTQIRGKADLLYVDDYVFIRNSPGRDYPYEDWQISSDRNKIYIDNAKY